VSYLPFFFSAIVLLRLPRISSSAMLFISTNALLKSPLIFYWDESCLAQCIIIITVAIFGDVIVHRQYIDHAWLHFPTLLLLLLPHSSQNANSCH
jgi:hypothetical protein